MLKTRPLALWLSVKEHLAVIKGFLKEGGSSGVAPVDGLRPSHKTLEWTLGSTKLADLTNSLEVASLKRHANEDVGIGMPAALRRAKEPNRITFSGVKWAASRSVKASSASWRPCVGGSLCSLPSASAGQLHRCLGGSVEAGSADGKLWLRPFRWIVLDGPDFFGTGVAVPGGYVGRSSAAFK